MKVVELVQVRLLVMEGREEQQLEAMEVPALLIPKRAADLDAVVHPRGCWWDLHLAMHAFRPPWGHLPTNQTRLGSWFSRGIGNGSWFSGGIGNGSWSWFFGGMSISQFCLGYSWILAVGAGCIDAAGSITHSSN